MTAPVRSAREFDIKGKMSRGQCGEDKARVREEEKRNVKLVGAAEINGELAEWCRL